MDIKEQKKGLRFNEGKPKLSLISLKELEPMARVLEFGANKYSNYSFLPNFEVGNLIKIQCQKKVNVKDVEIQNHFLQKNYVPHVIEKKIVQKQDALFVIKNDYFLENQENVEVVMKNIDLNQDLKNSKENLSIKESTEIDLNLKNKNDSEVLKDLKILSIKAKLNDKTFWQDLNGMVSQNKNITFYVKEDVQSVEVQKDHILTMIMVLENSEICFVVNATKQLDCYKILLKLLKKLWNILLNINDISSFISGRDNWKGGLKMTEILDSMMRHIAALQSGEWTDPESGLPHIGHIQCNALFLGGENNEIDLEFKCCGDWDENGECTCKYMKK